MKNKKQQWICGRCGNPVYLDEEGYIWEFSTDEAVCRPCNEIKPVKDGISYTWPIKPAEKEDKADE